MKATPRMRALIQPLREALTRMDNTFASEVEFDARTTQRTFTFAMSDLGEMVFMPKILSACAGLRRVPPCDQLPRARRRSSADSRPARSTSRSDTSPISGRSHSTEAPVLPLLRCLLRADHPITADALSMEQFLSLEHAVVYGAGRTHEISNVTAREEDLSPSRARNPTLSQHPANYFAVGSRRYGAARCRGVRQGQAYESPHGAADTHPEDRSEITLASKFPARSAEQVAAQCRGPVHG